MAGLLPLDPEPVLELEPVPEAEPEPTEEPPAAAPGAVPPGPQPVKTRLAPRPNVTAISRREAQKRIQLLGKTEEIKALNEQKKRTKWISHQG
jgi:hypothetical protein